MKALSLEDLIPNKAEFTLSNGKTFTLRNVNLEDQVWMRQKFGDQKEQQEIFQKQDWAKIASIVYRFIEEKNELRPEEIDDFDDDGNPFRRTVTGPERLLRLAPGGMDGLRMVAAFNRAIMNSNPVMAQAIIEELKKKILATQTGAESSTSSPVNTVGPSKKSRDSRQEKSA